MYMCIECIHNVHVYMYMCMYLLQETSPPSLSPAITLVRLPQQRVEWFGHACIGRGLSVHGAGKGCHVSQLLQSVPALHCSSEGLCIDEVLHHTLEERERLVDIHLWGGGEGNIMCVCI